MKALLLVDIQNDFLPGGALAVKDGRHILPAVQKLLHGKFDLIVATKDWHPPDHQSFAANHPGKQPGEQVMLGQEMQILWPIHCVQHSKGAEFAPGWDTARIHKIFYKGTNKDVDSYSAFYDNCHIKATGLGDYLQKQHVTELYIAGLATDYCVKYSALDATKLGLNTYVVIDACRGVELHPGDCQKAIEDMRAHGAHIVSSSDVLTGA